MIQGIIFDCFGVLSRGSLTHLASLAPPESQQEVYDVNHRSDRGYLEYNEYIRLMAELVGLSPDDIRRIFQQRHIPNRPLMQYAQSLRPKYKTALLSNVGHNVINQIFTADELDSMFDAVVLSAEVGAVKPYPEIYYITAERLGLAPEECIMIDDKLTNTEGAAMTGMKGVVFSSNQQVKAEIDRLTRPETLHA